MTIRENSSSFEPGGTYVAQGRTLPRRNDREIPLAPLGPSGGPPGHGGHARPDRGRRPRGEVLPAPSGAASPRPPLIRVRQPLPVGPPERGITAARSGHGPDRTAALTRGGGAGIRPRLALARHQGPMAGRRA